MPDPANERPRPLVRVVAGLATGAHHKLWAYEGFGFLETPDGVEVYFHRNSVLHNAFDRLTIGSAVEFVQEAGDKGPQASTVKVAG